MTISRIRYYLTSIPTILWQIVNWPALILAFLGQRRIVIKLRNGPQFLVRSLMDAWIVKESCLDRDYERHSVKIEDGWTIIDIGAGIGDFAILTARENPNSHVYAYEPFAESYRLIQENIALNGVHNISVFQTAATAVSGRMRLFATGAPVQHSVIEKDLPANIGVEEVEALSLDDIFQVNDIVRCHFLKIDCEGCEFELLFKASPATLAKIDHICLEYHNGFTEYDHRHLTNYLRESGFQAQSTPNPVHPYLGFLYACRIQKERLLT